MNTALVVLSVPLLAIALSSSLLWVARDAARRGRSAAWVTFLCFLTWPLGLLIWRGLRPPPRIRAHA